MTSLRTNPGPVCPKLTPESFGYDVLGPVVGQFCLRLWALTNLMHKPDDAVMLFCARGGLRMQMAYEHYLRAAHLSSPLPMAPLMVSRVVAARPSLARTIDSGGAAVDGLLPAAATALTYEFRRATLADVAMALSGVVPEGDASGPFTPATFTALLRDVSGAAVAHAVIREAVLFVRHLRDAMRGRRHAVLVDTGLFGTTAQLLDEGVEDLTFSSALLARSFRPGTTPPRTTGLLLEAAEYSPLRRRTALLRHWHFVEWLFEPDLPSARTFTDDHGAVRSNLEQPGWQAKVSPPSGHPFAGVLAYLDSLGPGSAERVEADADRAWTALRRAIVWPTREHGQALAVGHRSHDFGREEKWSHQPWRGTVAALRGSHMWREGDIARSGSPLRYPVLAAIEVAYGMRMLARGARRRG